MHVFVLLPHTVPAQQSASELQESRQQEGAAQSAVHASKSTEHPGSPQNSQMSGMHRPLSEHTVPSQHEPRVHESPQHDGGLHWTFEHSPLGTDTPPLPPPALVPPLPEVVPPNPPTLELVPPDGPSEGVTGPSDEHPSGSTATAAAHPTIITIQRRRIFVTMPGIVAQFGAAWKPYLEATISRSTCSQLGSAQQNQDSVRCGTKLRGARGGGGAARPAAE